MTVFHRLSLKYHIKTYSSILIHFLKDEKKTQNSIEVKLYKSFKKTNSQNILR